MKSQRGFNLTRLEKQRWESSYHEPWCLLLSFWKDKMKTKGARAFPHPAGCTRPGTPSGHRKVSPLPRTHVYFLPGKKILRVM